MTDNREEMEQHIYALEFGEEVFRDGLVDTQYGDYLASVMREARKRLENEMRETQK